METPCRYEGKIAIFDKHLKDGVSWRRIVAGLVITVILQVVAFAYGYGLLTGNVASISKNVEAHEIKFEKQDNLLQEILKEVRK